MNNHSSLLLLLKGLTIESTLSVECYDGDGNGKNQYLSKSDCTFCLVNSI
jgi:hypothetical protein